MTWENFNASLQELDRINLMDCISKDDELGDFFTEIGQLANAEDSALGMLNDDFMVVDNLPMDFISTHDDDDQPKSPPPFSHSRNDDDTTTDVFLSSSASAASDIQDLENQYQLAVEQLRESMKRSQQTRQQIIRNQLFLQPSSGAPVVRMVSDSCEFFAGSRSTLTSGLEQSRSMLMSYMQQMEGL